MKRFAIPFLDVQTLLVLVLLLLIFACLMKISDADNKAKVDSNSRYIITMDWDDGSQSDIDLWLALPTGDKVSFRNRQAAFASLDHDDLGLGLNTITDDAGNTITLRKREEVDYIRQTVLGTYTVNAHAYHLVDGPVHVRITMMAVGEHTHTVTARELTLSDNHEEKTAFRVTFDASGEVVSTDTIEDLFANETLSKQ